jgi:hypothetical protein
VAPIETIEAIQAGPNAGQPVRDAADNPIWRLDDASLVYEPVYWTNITSAYGTEGQRNPYVVPLDPTQGYWSRLDTFYIVFDRFGGVRQFPDRGIIRNDPKTHYWYRDVNQPYPDPNGGPKAAPIFPLVNHPDSSARGVLIYNRAQFQELPNTDADRRAFLAKAKPVYVSRSLGELVEGRQ